jgi:hypothetical protein
MVSAIAHVYPRIGSSWRDMLRPALTIPGHVVLGVVQGPGLEDVSEVKEVAPNALIHTTEDPQRLCESSTFETSVRILKDLGCTGQVYYSHSKGCSERWPPGLAWVGKAWGESMHAALVNHPPTTPFTCAWLALLRGSNAWAPDGNFFWFDIDAVPRDLGLSGPWSVINMPQRFFSLDQVTVLCGVNQPLRKPSFWTNRNYGGTLKWASD